VGTGHPDHNGTRERTHRIKPDASCHASVEASATIAIETYADEVTFRFGSDDALVVAFDPKALSRFLAVAPAALEESREKLAKRLAEEG
jgi:hypothetical protein